MKAKTEMALPLLILDLDEMLILRTEMPWAQLPELIVGSIGIYLRPHIDRFLGQASAAMDPANECRMNVECHIEPA